MRENAPVVVLRGDGDDPAGQPDDHVVLDVGVLVAVPEELDRGREKQQTEDEEDERERRDERRAESDAYSAHPERAKDPERENALLVLDRHSERRQDHDEYEQV